MTSWTKPPEVVFEEFSRLVGYLSAACDKIMHDGPNSFTEVARTTTTQRWVMLENMRKNMGQMPEVTSMPGYPELAEQANEVVKRLTSLLPAQAQPVEPEASQRDVVDVPAHIQRDKLEKEVREKVLEITGMIEKGHGDDLNQISQSLAQTTETQQKIREYHAEVKEKVAGAGAATYEGLEDLQEYEQTSKKRTKTIWIVVVVCVIVVVIVITFTALAVAKVI